MIQSDLSELLLDELLKWDIPGITKTFAQNCVGASLVCLDNQHHHSGVVLGLYEGDNFQKVNLKWLQSLDIQLQRTWRDLAEATEYGSVGLAILLVLKRTAYTILERSVRGNGFDYWLLDKELSLSSELIEQASARLEISGILNAEKSGIIQNRIKEKLAQTSPSDDTHLPALIIVVEFGHPEVHMVWKHERNS